MSFVTTAFAPTTALCPTLTIPIIVQPGPRKTPSPIVGQPFRGPRLVWPIVTPCDKLQLQPIVARSLTTIPPKCPMNRPGPTAAACGMLIPNLTSRRCRHQSARMYAGAMTGNPRSQPAALIQNVKRKPGSLAYVLRKPRIPLAPSYRYRSANTRYANEYGLRCGFTRQPPPLIRIFE